MNIEKEFKIKNVNIKKISKNRVVFVCNDNNIKELKK